MSKIQVPGGLIDDFDDAAASGSQNARNTALANKLTSVLSTSFTDGEIQEALRYLDTRDVQNTAENRRRLRQDVQKEVIESNGDIIHDFGQVAEQLKRIGSIIENLNRTCEEMRGSVTAAHRETGPVLEEAEVLLVQKKDVETKQQLLTAFNEHFILPGDDLDTLTSTSSPVNDEFFSLLNRLKRVHTDCQILLGSENEQLGLELMDRSTRNLDAAFQKLYRWIQKELQSLDLENPRMSASIRRALRVLAEKPALFQNCLDFFAESRERNLADAFYSALTGASTQTDDRTTKPMEYYSHEPLRFVGDMLAWTHSAAVSEHEALEVLFISEGDEMAKGIKAGMANEPWLQDNAQDFDGKRSLDMLVNRDLAGVARALRQRIEQAIQSDDDPVLAYKISSLIDFYRVTFTRLLGAESSVLETLERLQESAVAHYKKIMNDHASSLKDAGYVPDDLSAPPFLDDILAQLKEVMKSYDSSFTAPDLRESVFAPILADSLDPVLASCERAAGTVEEPSKAIFSINCLIAAKLILAAFDFTTGRVADIDDAIDEHAAHLVDYQHAYLLHTSGLHPLLVALAPLTDSEDDLKSIASLEPFQQQPLGDASQVLDDFLPSALMDAMENLKQLENLHMAEEITNDAASRFCEDFEYVESRLIGADEILARDEEDGAQDINGEDGQRRMPLRAIFPRTSGEIRVLLS